MAGREHSDLMLSENELLEKLKKLWIPSFKLGYLGKSIPRKLEEEDILKKKILCLSNKITPQKFEALLEQIKNLNICSERKLDIVIQMFFNRAVSESLYCATYARTVKHLALIEVPRETGESVSFQLLFLKKCQNEFEQSLLEIRKYSEDQENVWHSEEQSNARHKLLGVVRLIGELFNQHVLSESRLFEYLEKLHSKDNEILLEALYVILKVAGKELCLRKFEKDSAVTLELLFKEIQEIISEHQSSPRIRFLLQDVIDLKENNWIPRRTEFVPKTLKEVHNEAYEESN